MIQTVLGLISPEKFGFVLPHEHVLCDFIGADKTNASRWNGDVVAKAIAPNLVAAKKRGVTGFVDCTPAYIGRDPRILKRLAQETGLHILTNTGYYGGAGDKFVPKHAYTESAEQLAERWRVEAKDGIEGTGIRPGFIKIGVDEAPSMPPKLTDIDAKIVRAAALASRKTGLSVTCHTGGASGGMAAATLFIESGGTASRFIVAHSDSHGLPTNKKVAELGCFVSLDGHGWRTAEESLQTLLPLLEAGHESRILLSMDSGWYNAGEPNGGTIRDYDFLVDAFLPALEKRGVTKTTIHTLTRKNPQTAFALAAAK